MLLIEISTNFTFTGQMTLVCPLPNNVCLVNIVRMWFRAS